MSSYNNRMIREWALGKPAVTSLADHARRLRVSTVSEVKKMAYFPNGSDAESYFARYCDRCVHQEGGCPVLEFHHDWNYDQVGENADWLKKHVLDTLWPREPVYGIHNGDCRMFVKR